MWPFPHWSMTDLPRSFYRTLQGNRVSLPSSSWPLVQHWRQVLYRMRNENYPLLGVLKKWLTFVSHSFNPAYSPGGAETGWNAVLAEGKKTGVEGWVSLAHSWVVRNPSGFWGKWRKLLSNFPQSYLPWNTHPPLCGLTARSVTCASGWGNFMLWFILGSWSERAF